MSSASRQGSRAVSRQGSKAVSRQGSKGVSRQGSKGSTDTGSKGIGQFIRENSKDRVNTSLGIQTMEELSQMKQYVFNAHLHKIQTASQIINHSLYPHNVSKGKLGGTAASEAGKFFCDMAGVENSIVQHTYAKDAIIGGAHYNPYIPTSRPMLVPFKAKQYMTQGQAARDGQSQKKKKGLMNILNKYRKRHMLIGCTRTSIYDKSDVQAALKDEERTTRLEKKEHARIAEFRALRQKKLDEVLGQQSFVNDLQPLKVNLRGPALEKDDLGNLGNAAETLGIVQDPNFDKHNQVFKHRLGIALPTPKSMITAEKMYIRPEKKRESDDEKKPNKRGTGVSQRKSIKGQARGSMSENDADDLRGQSKTSLVSRGSRSGSEDKNTADRRISLASIEDFFDTHPQEREALREKEQIRAFSQDSKTRRASKVQGGNANLKFKPTMQQLRRTIRVDEDNIEPSLGIYSPTRVEVVMNRFSESGRIRRGERKMMINPDSPTTTGGREKNNTLFQPNEVDMYLVKKHQRGRTMQREKLLRIKSHSIAGGELDVDRIVEALYGKNETKIERDESSLTGWRVIRSSVSSSVSSVVAGVVVGGGAMTMSPRSGGGNTGVASFRAGSSAAGGGQTTAGSGDDPGAFSRKAGAGSGDDRASPRSIQQQKGVSNLLAKAAVGCTNPRMPVTKMSSKTLLGEVDPDSPKNESGAVGMVTKKASKDKAVANEKIHLEGVHKAAFFNYTKQPGYRFCFLEKENLEIFRDYVTPMVRMSQIIQYKSEETGNSTPLIIGNTHQTISKQGSVSKNGILNAGESPLGDGLLDASIGVSSSKSKTTAIDGIYEFERNVFMNSKEKNAYVNTPVGMIPWKLQYKWQERLIPNIVSPAISNNFVDKMAFLDLNLGRIVQRMSVKQKALLQNKYHFLQLKIQWGVAFPAILTENTLLEDYLQHTLTSSFNPALCSMGLCHVEGLTPPDASVVASIAPSSSVTTTLAAIPGQTFFGQPYGATPMIGTASSSWSTGASTTASSGFSFVGGDASAGGMGIVEIPRKRLTITEQRLREGEARLMKESKLMEKLINRLGLNCASRERKFMQRKVIRVEQYHPSEIIVDQYGRMKALADRTAIGRKAILPKSGKNRDAAVKIGVGGISTSLGSPKSALPKTRPSPKTGSPKQPEPLLKSQARALGQRQSSKQTDLKAQETDERIGGNARKTFFAMREEVGSEEEKRKTQMMRTLWEPADDKEHIVNAQLFVTRNMHQPHTSHHAFHDYGHSGNCERHNPTSGLGGLSGLSTLAKAVAGTAATSGSGLESLETMKTQFEAGDLADIVAIASVETPAIASVETPAIASVETPASATVESPNNPGLNPLQQNVLQQNASQESLEKDASRNPLQKSPQKNLPGSGVSTVIANDSVDDNNAAASFVVDNTAPTEADGQSLADVQAPLPMDYDNCHKGELTIMEKREPTQEEKDRDTMRKETVRNLSILGLSPRGRDAKKLIDSIDKEMDTRIFIKKLHDYEMKNQEDMKKQTRGDHKLEVKKQTGVVVDQVDDESEFRNDFYSAIDDGKDLASSDATIEEIHPLESITFWADSEDEDAPRSKKKKHVPTKQKSESEFRKDYYSAVHDAVGGVEVSPTPQKDVQDEGEFRNDFYSPKTAESVPLDESGFRSDFYSAGSEVKITTDESGFQNDFYSVVGDPAADPATDQQSKRESTDTLKADEETKPRIDVEPSKPEEETDSRNDFNSGVDGADPTTGSFVVDGDHQTEKGDAAGLETPPTEATQLIADNPQCGDNVLTNVEASRVEDVSANAPAATEVKQKDVKADDITPRGSLDLGVPTEKISQDVYGDLLLLAGGDQRVIRAESAKNSKDDGKAGEDVELGGRSRTRNISYQAFRSRTRQATEVAHQCYAGQRKSLRLNLVQGKEKSDATIETTSGSVEPTTSVAEPGNEVTTKVDLSAKEKQRLTYSYIKLPSLADVFKLDPTTKASEAAETEQAPLEAGGKSKKLGPRSVRFQTVEKQDTIDGQQMSMMEKHGSEQKSFSEMGKSFSERPPPVSAKRCVVRKTFVDPNFFSPMRKSVFLSKNIDGNVGMNPGRSGGVGSLIISGGFTEDEEEQGKKMRKSVTLFSKKRIRPSGDIMLDLDIFSNSRNIMPKRTTDDNHEDRIDDDDDTKTDQVSWTNHIAQKEESTESEPEFPQMMMIPHKVPKIHIDKTHLGFENSEGHTWPCILDLYNDVIESRLVALAQEQTRPERAQTVSPTGTVALGGAKALGGASGVGSSVAVGSAAAGFKARRESALLASSSAAGGNREKNVTETTIALTVVWENTQKSLRKLLDFAERAIKAHKKAANTSGKSHKSMALGGSHHSGQMVGKTHASGSSHHDDPSNPKSAERISKQSRQMSSMMSTRMGGSTNRSASKQSALDRAMRSSRSVSAWSRQTKSSNSISGNFGSSKQVSGSSASKSSSHAHGYGSHYHDDHERPDRRSDRPLDDREIRQIVERVAGVIELDEGMGGSIINAESVLRLAIDTFDLAKIQAIAVEGGIDRTVGKATAPNLPHHDSSPRDVDRSPRGSHRSPRDRFSPRGSDRSPWGSDRSPRDSSRVMLGHGSRVMNHDMKGSICEDSSNDKKVGFAQKAAGNGLSLSSSQRISFQGIHPPGAASPEPASQTSQISGSPMLSIATSQMSSPISSAASGARVGYADSAVSGSAGSAGSYLSGHGTRKEYADPSSSSYYYGGDGRSVLKIEVILDRAERFRLQYGKDMELDYEREKAAKALQFSLDKPKRQKNTPTASRMHDSTSRCGAMGAHSPRVSAMMGGPRRSVKVGSHSPRGSRISLGSHSLTPIGSKKVAMGKPQRLPTDSPQQRASLQQGSVEETLSTVDGSVVASISIGGIKSGEMNSSSPSMGMGQNSMQLEGIASESMQMGFNSTMQMGTGTNNSNQIPMDKESSNKAPSTEQIMYEEAPLKKRKKNVPGGCSFVLGKPGDPLESDGKDSDSSDEEKPPPVRPSKEFLSILFQDFEKRVHMKKEKILTKLGHDLQKEKEDELEKLRLMKKQIANAMKKQIASAKNASTTSRRAASSPRSVQSASSPTSCRPQSSSPRKLKPNYKKDRKRNAAFVMKAIRQSIRNSEPIPKTIPGSVASATKKIQDSVPPEKNFDFTTDALFFDNELDIILDKTCGIARNGGVTASIGESDDELNEYEIAFIERQIKEEARKNPNNARRNKEFLAKRNQSNDGSGFEALTNKKSKRGITCMDSRDEVSFMRNIRSKLGMNRFEGLDNVASAATIVESIANLNKGTQSGVGGTSTRGSLTARSSAESQMSMHSQMMNQSSYQRSDQSRHSSHPSSDSRSPGTRSTRAGGGVQKLSKNTLAIDMSGGGGLSDRTGDKISDLDLTASKNRLGDSTASKNRLGELDDPTPNRLVFDDGAPGPDPTPAADPGSDPTACKNSSSKMSGDLRASQMPADFRGSRAVGSKMMSSMSRSPSNMDPSSQRSPRRSPRYSGVRSAEDDYHLREAERKKALRDRLENPPPGVNHRFWSVSPRYDKKRKGWWHLSKKFNPLRPNPAPSMDTKFRVIDVAAEIEPSETDSEEAYNMGFFG